MSLQVPRSIVALVACLGVMKSGCAYVALSDTFPVARNQFLLEDSRARAVVLTYHAPFNPPPQLMHVILDDSGGVMDLSSSATPRGLPDVLLTDCLPAPKYRPDVQVPFSYLLYTK